MSPGLPAHSLPGSLAETENLPACGSASEHVSVHATMHAVCTQLRLYTHAPRRAYAHLPCTRMHLGEHARSYLYTHAHRRACAHLPRARMRIGEHACTDSRARMRIEEHACICLVLACASVSMRAL